MSTEYEWDIEYADEHGDIIDHYQTDKLASYPDGVFRAVNGDDIKLVMVRDAWSPSGGHSRSWAYAIKDQGSRVLGIGRFSRC